MNDVKCPALMGIVNCTPDSFSDGGLSLAPEKALAHTRTLVQDGASWIDIGGESTRPGAAAVTEEEELRRVLPVLEGLQDLRPQTKLSIDTRKAAVARAALSVGVDMVNDVAGATDPGMLEAIAASQAGVCLMHMQGLPTSMQVDPSYADVVQEVHGYLKSRVAAAVAAGVPRSRIHVDPGIGFGKTVDHNCHLLRSLEELRQRTACPVLIGVSRKSLIPAITGRESAPAERDSASHVLHALVMNHCDIIRLHDVRGGRDTLRLVSALRC